MRKLIFITGFNLIQQFNCRSQFSMILTEINLSISSINFCINPSFEIGSEKIKI